MSVCVSVSLSLCVYVCPCVCVHDHSKNSGSVPWKLEHVVLSLSNQGQGHSMTLKFFSIYHNTNCQVLFLSFGTC